MEKPICIVGIDLGTSHSALSYWYAGMDQVQVHQIEQIETMGQRKKSSTLPSVVYLPPENELNGADLALPWDTQSAPKTYCVGRWARLRGPEVPERYISSAKSWLCSQLAKSGDAILPWQSSVNNKMSPIAAMQLYLEHLIHSFIYAQQQEGQEFSITDIELVLTVPASFDEHARQLTEKAARDVGFIHLSLLEEPQAAFYAWIASREKEWRNEVKAGDLVLVCDVGGGTTDFSLIAVDSIDGELTLERVSVGRHLLLGGENMDLSLAYQMKAKLASRGEELDHWEFVSMVNQVREAKEKLCSDPELNECQLVFAGKGAKLFAKTKTVDLSREELKKTLLDGFFPLSGRQEFPLKRNLSGFQELGLAYEHDPAISRHLAEFLAQSLKNCEANADLNEFMKKRGLDSDPHESGLLLPSKILFNGGVFKAEPLKNQVAKLLNSWKQSEDIQVIASQSLDLSVAVGAGFLGRSRRSQDGIRIASGTARSFYLGLEAGGMAVPGLPPAVKGLCIVPQGTEEGSQLEMPSQVFGLQTGQEVVLRFFSSSVRAGDKIGHIVENAKELEETTSLKLSLPSLPKEEQVDPSDELVPVQLDARVSDVGTLCLSMKHLHSTQSWNLEFNVRSESL